LAEQEASVYGPRITPGNVGDQDLDEAAHQSERIRAWIRTAQEDLSKIVGIGRGPTGHVTARVDPNGQVLDVAFDSRSLRLGSQALSGEVLVAVRVAAEDAERQACELIREALPGFDPAEASAQLGRLLDAD
jgi:DNA-binding protein YbaB